MAAATAEQETLDSTEREPCTACTRGWRRVSEQWAMQQAEVVLDDGTKAYDAERLAAYRACVYPCKDCKPNLFYRWAGKHFDPEHDPSNCTECIGRAAKGAARRRALPQLPERRDLD
jgi:hypothetical protein